MTARGLWIRIGLGYACAGSSLLLAPPVPTSSRVTLVLSAPVGALAGALLFVALSRQRAASTVSTPHAPGPTAVAFILSWATVEELLWRRLVLGGLATTVGALGALVATSWLFALAHSERRAHLVTGSAFGILYLAAGQIGVPIVAHATYNLLAAQPLVLRVPAGDRG